MDINYPELGWPDQVQKWYAEGETMVHPSGAVYKRINGNWVCVKKPNEG